MPRDQRRAEYGEGWRSPDAARAYEADLRREGWYGGWLEQRERELLFDVVDRRLGGREIRYLDFACGTGRILAALQNRVASATGIDTSAEMLELARRKAPSVELICGDAVVDPSVLGGSYDLVTAFRFFLNAGESLRRDVLAVLHDALAEDGILVFNIHSNAWSLRALSVLVRRLAFRQHWWNQLSYRAIREELGACGFEVVELQGYNYLTVKGYRLLPAAVVPWLERSLSRPRPLRYLAVDLLLVCSRASGGGGSNRGEDRPIP